MVEFAEFTEAEREAVRRITDRALAIYKKAGVRRGRKEIAMDLSAVHAVRPLRLLKLAEADDFNLMHDVTGIANHIDRETGELGGCFVPRYAAPEAPHGR